MRPELHVIERVCGRSTPGALRKIVLIDPHDLASQPDWLLVPSMDAIEFLPGKGGYDFEFDRLSAQLSDSTSTNNDGGDFIEYRLEARLRKVRIEAELLRAKIRNRQLCVAATYYDGTVRLVPNMRLTLDGDSGARPTSRQGYVLRGVGRHSHPAPYVGGSVNVIGGPYVPPPPPDLGSGVQIVTETVTDPTFNYTIPANKWLVGWELKSSSPQTVSLGTSPGGDELGGPVALSANESWVGQGNMLPTWTAINIYFSGLSGTNSIQLWFLG